MAEIPTTQDPATIQAQKEGAPFQTGTPAAAPEAPQPGSSRTLVMSPLTGIDRTSLVTGEPGQIRRPAVSVTSSLTTRGSEARQAAIQVRPTLPPDLDGAIAAGVNAKAEPTAQVTYSDRRLSQSGEQRIDSQPGGAAHLAEPTSNNSKAANSALVEHEVPAVGAVLSGGEKEPRVVRVVVPARTTAEHDENTSPQARPAEVLVDENKPDQPDRDKTGGANAEERELRMPDPNEQVPEGSGTPFAGGPRPPDGPGLPEQSGSDSPDRDPLKNARAELRDYVVMIGGDTKQITAMQIKLLEIEREAMRRLAMVQDTDPEESPRYQELDGEIRNLNRENYRRFSEGDLGTNEAYITGGRIHLAYYQDLPPSDVVQTSGNPNMDRKRVFQETGAPAAALAEQGRVNEAIAFVQAHNPTRNVAMAAIYEREIAAARIAQADLQRQREIAVEAADLKKASTYEFGTLFHARGDMKAIGTEAEKLVRVAAGRIERVSPPDDEEAPGEFEGQREFGELRYDQVTVNHAFGGTKVYDRVVVKMKVVQPFGRQLPDTLEIPQQQDAATMDVTSIQLWDGNVSYEYLIHKSINAKNKKVTYRIQYVPPTSDIPEFYLTSSPPLSEKRRVKEVLDTLLVTTAAETVLDTLGQRATFSMQDLEKATAPRFVPAENRLADFIDGGKPNSIRVRAVTNLLQRQEAIYLAELLQIAQDQRLDGIDPAILDLARKNAQRAMNAEQANQPVKDRQRRVHSYAVRGFENDVWKLFYWAAVISRPATTGNDKRTDDIINNIVAVRKAKEKLAELRDANRTKKQPKLEISEEEPESEAASRETRLQKRFGRLYTVALAHLKADRSIDREVGSGEDFTVHDPDMRINGRIYTTTISTPPEEGKSPERIAENAELTFRIGRHAIFGGSLRRVYDEERLFTLTHVSLSEYKALRSGSTRLRRVRSKMDRRGQASQAAEPRAEERNVAVIVDGLGMLVTGRQDLELIRDVLNHMPKPTE